MFAVAVQLPPASSVSAKAVAGVTGIDPIAAERTSADTNDNLRIVIYPLDQRPVGIDPSPAARKRHRWCHSHVTERCPRRDVGCILEAARMHEERRSRFAGVSVSSAPM
jgi:hypothetical protein